MRRWLPACGLVSDLVLGLVWGLTLAGMALRGAEAQAPAPGEDLCGEPKAEPQALYDRLAKDGRLREMGRSEEYVALENGQDGTLWSFTLPAHPAHPAAVCRRVVERRGIIDIPTTILCRGPEGECARLKSDFEALNERMIKELDKQAR